MFLCLFLPLLFWGWLWDLYALIRQIEGRLIYCVVVFLG